MSGHFNKKSDGSWVRSSLKQGKFSEVEEALIMSAFDEQTDMDVTDIKNHVEQEKFLRKVCLTKMLIFPMELLAISVTLGLNKGLEHVELVKIYAQYYRKKIGFNEFQARLKNLINKEKTNAS